MAKIAFDELTFVVADGNAHMRRIIRTFLSAFGSREVLEAEDGASCLEAVKARSPDILISDIMTPVLDGIALTRTIRDPEAGHNPFLPIIILSAYPEKRHVIAARDAGATEFLCKPVSASALHRRIHDIIAHPRDFVRTKTYFGPDRRRYVNPNYSGVDRRTGRRSDNIVEPSPAHVQAR